MGGDWPRGPGSPSPGSSSRSAARDRPRPGRSGRTAGSTRTSKLPSQRKSSLFTPKKSFLVVASCLSKIMRCLMVNMLVFIVKVQITGTYVFIT